MTTVDRSVNDYISKEMRVAFQLICLYRVHVFECFCQYACLLHIKQSIIKYPPPPLSLYLVLSLSV